MGLRGVRLANDSLPVDPTLAWLVGPGDVVLGGAQVLTVSREVVGRTVRIVLSDGQVLDLTHDAPVEIVRRAL